MSNNAKEYKYYLRLRPWSIGTLPEDYLRVDEDDIGADKGGRYGAVYFDRKLTDEELQHWGLVPDEEDLMSDAELYELATAREEVADAVRLKAYLESKSK